MLRTGSSAEGLVLPPHMSSPKPDVDVLFLLNSFVIQTSDADEAAIQPLKHFTHVLDRGDLPEGYIFVRDVYTNDYIFASYIRELSWNFAEQESVYGTDVEPICYHGPALLFGSPQEEMDVDVTHGLECTGPFPEMKEFGERERSRWWCEKFDLNEILNKPGLLVPTCPPNTTIEMNDRVFRMSFCAQESNLFNCIDDDTKDLLKGFKFLMKSQIDIIDSYHCKTAFMWLLETVSYDQWQTMTKKTLFIDMVEKMISFLKSNHFPSYWIPNCNLIMNRTITEITEGIEQLESMINNVNHIFSFDDAMLKFDMTTSQKSTLISFLR